LALRVGGHRRQDLRRRIRFRAPEPLFRSRERRSWH
jgi:hypothetical protein